MKHLLLFLCLKSSFLFAQTNELDYEIYSAILSQEIPKKAKTIVIRKKTTYDDSQMLLLSLEYLKDECGKATVFHKNAQCHQLAVLGGDYRGLTEYKNDSICLDTLVTKLVYQLDTLKRAIKNHFSVSQDIIMQSSADLSYIFRQDGWEKFRKKYRKPYGIIELSQVVYSDNREFAVFYFGYQKNSFNGLGRLMVIDLRNNQIKVHKTIRLWIS